MKKICSFLSLLLFFLPGLEAKIIYINAHASGTHDGTSWETAYTSYSGVYGESSAGDTVVFAAGLYPVSSGSRYGSMKIKDGVKVFGGFSGNEVINASSLENRNFYSHQTILNGDVNGDDYTTGNIKDNVYHVVEFDASGSSITSDTRLDGFIIIGGNSGDGGDGSPISGGGIFLEAGGDYFDTYVCNPVLANLKIMSNRASRNGGGAFLYATEGICSPTFLNCEFSGNYAGSTGGAVSVIPTRGECSPVFQNCSFHYNTVGTGYPSVGSAVFVEVDGYGGYVSKANPVFNQTSFCNNVGKYDAAIAIYAGSTYSTGSNYFSIRILNSTFVNNGNYAIMLKKYESVQSFDALIANSILWGGNTLNTYQVTPVIHHSIIQGSGGSGAGWSSSLGTDGGDNLDSDPLLANDPECDFRLMNGSPALDAGADSIGNNIGFYQGPGLASAASIYASGFTWLFGERDLNTTSTEYSYKVAARNLTEDLEIRVPEGFAITAASGVYTGDTTVLTLSPAGGTVDTTEVYVRFTPTEQKVYYGNITHSSADAITKLISISGKGVILPPTLVFPFNVSFDEVEVGQTSTIKGYSLSGTRLTSDVGIKLTGPFIMSLAPGELTNKYKELVIPQENGMIDTLVYFQFMPESEGLVEGSIRMGSDGADSVITTISGTGIIIPPSLNAAPESLNFDNTHIGGMSTGKEVVVSGTDLDGKVFMGAPEGFLLSLVEFSETQNFSNLELEVSDETLSATSVYVKFKPLTEGLHKDSVWIASPNTDTLWIRVEGTGVIPPPVLEVSTLSLNMGTVKLGKSSLPKTILLNGDHLISDVKTGAQGEIYLSTDASGDNKTRELTFSPTEGKIEAAEVYVYYVPSGDPSALKDSIYIASTGIDTFWVQLTGESVETQPEIDLSTDNLNFGSVLVGEKSVKESIEISGVDLTGNVFVSAPEGYKISLEMAAEVPSFSEVELSYNGESIQPNMLYIQFIPESEKSYADRISFKTEGRDTVWLNVEGEGYELSPEFSISEEMMEFDTLRLGGPGSDIYNFRINGMNLESSVKVIPPAGVKVWENDISGDPVTSPDTLFVPSGPVSIPYNMVDKWIWVRLAPEQTGSYEDSIKILTDGAEAFYLIIKGHLKDENTALESIAQPDPEIYPNPFTHGFKITSVEEILKVTLMDATGVARAEFHRTNTISLSELDPGLYFVRIETENGIRVKQVIKR